MHKCNKGKEPEPFVVSTKKDPVISYTLFSFGEHQYLEIL